MAQRLAPSFLQGTVLATSSNSVFTVTKLYAQMNSGRYQHFSILTNSGKILLGGGINCGSTGSCAYLNSAELFDPTSGTTANTGNMQSGALLRRSSLFLTDQRTSVDNAALDQFCLDL